MHPNMIATHPDVNGSVSDRLVRCIVECAPCAQTCTSCADACLAEGMVEQLRDCIPLLVLEGDPALRPRDRREAGLFHTAFLLPTRADLGRWFAHARASDVRLDGASDPRVSEAIYLAFPEGSDIEIYAASVFWPRRSGAIAMATEPLDAESLIAAGQGATWSGMPEDGVIGQPPKVEEPVSGVRCR